MADIEVEGVIQTVSQLLDEYAGLIEGAEKQVEDLLRSLNYLLEEFRYNNQRKQYLDEDIRSELDEIELVIDKFVSDAKSNQERNVSDRCFPCDRKTKVEKLAEELICFAQVLDEIPEKSRQNESAKSAMAGYYKRKFCAPKRVAAEPQDLTLDDKEAVGNINKDVEKLIKRLIEGPEEVDVVPIVGMVGIGKTTLAQRIYSDPLISSNFPTKIWIEVRQSCDIEQISLETNKAIKSERRCLVVLDDVWEESVIDSVKKAFLENKKSHRIMMTTRLEQVATKANEDPHYLEFLTPNESFQLLKMKVGERNFPHELLGLGESIARKCSGLPLSVVVIAKQLRRSMGKSNWIRIEKNVGNPLLNKDDPESCLKVVKLSYDHLPHEMKECYLYCSIFPQGFEIPAWKLTRLWIAERLIFPESPSTLEETAESYLSKLVDRNLLMVKKRSSDGRIKTCCMQDLLHEFCKTEATSRMILQEVCQTPHQAAKGSYTSQRLCLVPSDVHGFLSAKPTADQVRSFYCFPSKQTQIELSSVDLQLVRKGFPLIRVLDIACLKIRSNEDLSHLIHLKYLAISGEFTDLPEFFGNFRNLQTLIVNTSVSQSTTLDIKADIWSMSCLRHLHANVPVRLPVPLAPTGKDSCLQTLSIVAPESCKKDVISKASNLKKLSIRGKLIVFLETSGDGWHHFEDLKLLEQFKLTNCAAASMEREFPLSPSFSTSLCSLKKLMLSGTKFDWSEAYVLGKLAFLEVLKLKENAFMGRSWKPENGGFTTLQVLWIETTDLETWEAAGHHFPSLRNLVLIDCHKLNALPSELAGVLSLQEIRMVNTSTAAVISANEIARKKLESGKFKLTVSPPQN